VLGGKFVVDEAAYRQALRQDLAYGSRQPGLCRKVDDNILLSTSRSIFDAPSFQYVVWFVNFATEPDDQVTNGTAERRRGREGNDGIAKQVMHHILSRLESVLPEFRSRTIEDRDMYPYNPPNSPA
jgi:hypothetical protein